MLFRNCATSSASSNVSEVSPASAITPPVVRTQPAKVISTYSSNVESQIFLLFHASFRKSNKRTWPCKTFPDLFSRLSNALSPQPLTVSRAALCLQPARSLCFSCNIIESSLCSPPVCMQCLRFPGAQSRSAARAGNATRSYAYLPRSWWRLQYTLSPEKTAAHAHWFMNVGITHLPHYFIQYSRSQWPQRPMWVSHVRCTLKEIDPLSSIHSSVLADSIKSSPQNK